MLEAGADIVSVGNILGRSDIKMTMRYSHPDNSVKDAVELLTNNTAARCITDYHK